MKLTKDNAEQIGLQWYARAEALLRYGLDRKNPREKRTKALGLFNIMRLRTIGILILAIRANLQTKFPPGGIIAGGIHQNSSTNVTQPETVHYRGRLSHGRGINPEHSSNSKPDGEK